VLEDVHWADDATLDAITVLGRRIGSLPALVVLTYRAGEAGPPLRGAVGAIRADSAAFVELAPLSERAVATLAGDDEDVVATRAWATRPRSAAACGSSRACSGSVATARPRGRRPSKRSRR